jgi:hypothetical protein
MIKMKTGLAGALQRAGQVARLVRPAPAVPPPPYVKCAGCGKGGRGDQQVPDPDQFTTKKGITPAGDVVGNAAAVPGKPAVDVDAVSPVNWGAFNSDPGAAAERASEESARRGGYGPDIKLIDAAPIHCSCGRWFHAIRCYSLHRHD